jgi:hypothetical protein
VFLSANPHRLILNFSNYMKRIKYVGIEIALIAIITMAILIILNVLNIL